MAHSALNVLKLVVGSLLLAQILAKKSEEKPKWAKKDVRDYRWGKNL
jgi:hypothetical protein